MSLLDTASLIVTPNGYKEGKLYSVIPSDGSGDMSVTRATTATRVNSAGLFELVPYNLLSYSEQFNNAYWTNNGTSVSANAIVSPNGTTTADKIIEDSSNGVHHILMPNVTPSGTNTLSVYAKQGERNWVWLYLFDGVAGSLFAWFDVSTGTVGGVNSGLTATIESVGNGWYRCSITRTQGNTGNGGFGVTNANNVLSYTGNGTSGAYFWGAQLVEGSTAKDYQKTETRLNIPRLDYSNGTCPSLLVEPQRTNSCLYSEDFTQWSQSNVSVTANNMASPNGVQNADLITATSGSVHDVFRTFSGGTTNTVSVFVKKGTTQFVYLSTSYASTTSDYTCIIVDLNNNTFVNQSSGDVAFISGEVIDYGNGWVRVICTTSAASAVSMFSFFGISANNTFNLSLYGRQVSTTTGTAYFWGAQAELGSYATSYIPTTSASVTRNADVISKTGISSLIGQTEGTLFAEVIYDASIPTLAGGADQPLLVISDGTMNNIITILLQGSNDNRVGAYCLNSGAFQALILSSAQTSGTIKIAVSYNSNYFALFVNGVKIGQDTSVNVPTTNQLNIGSYLSFGSQFLANLKASAIWQTQLTDAQCQTLTTI